VDPRDVWAWPGIPAYARAAARRSSDQRIEREGARTGQREDRCRGEERERELGAVRQKESALQMDEEDGAEHGEGESERGDPRQQADDEGHRVL